MICAYGKCGKAFEPSRSNQNYHSTRCRESAKREKHSLLRVHQDDVPSVKAFLARRRRLRSGVTPLPGTQLWLFVRPHCGSRKEWNTMPDSKNEATAQPREKAGHYADLAFAMRSRHSLRSHIGSPKRCASSSVG